MQFSIKTAVAAVTRFRFAHAAGPLSAVVLVLTGFGAVAVAMAPLTSADTALPAQRVVTEQIAGDSLTAQLEALAEHDIELRSSGLTRDNDAVVAVMRRLGVQDPQAVAALARDEALRDALGSGAGRQVQVRTNGSGQLIGMLVRFPSDDAVLARTHFARLTVSRADTGWLSHVESAPFTTDARRAGGKVVSSFRVAAQDAGIPATVAAQVAELLGADPSAPREPRKGESFSVVYEARLADGEPASWAEGRVLAAELGSGGAAHQVIWFQEPGSAGAYYDGKGMPRPQGFMTAPLEFERVTSGFATRMDPILRRLMVHQGVDYAAPVGTPVYSVAPGVIEFAGRQSGYGNVVEVRHSSERTTLYAASTWHRATP